LVVRLSALDKINLFIHVYINLFISILRLSPWLPFLILGTLQALGLEKEIKRIEKRKTLGRKKSSRGRKYKKKVGPLIVVSEKCLLMDSSKNIPGVEAVKVKDLNVELLAPGSDPGRLCIWSDKAIEILQKDNLFFENESKLKKVVEKLGKKEIKKKIVKKELKKGEIKGDKESK